MAYGNRSPQQRAAIAEHLRDKEKLLNAPLHGATPTKMPKVPGFGGKLAGAMKIKEPHLAKDIVPPRFGRKTIFYGEKV